MNSKDLANATYKALMARQSVLKRLFRIRPKFDPDEVASVMREVAHTHGAPIFAYPEAVSILQRLLK